MFKLLRKTLIGVVALIIGAVAFYYLKNPNNRREIVQTATEVQDEFRKEKVKPVWTGTVVAVDALEGDRAVVNTENAPRVAVRLAGIDAPELPDKFKRNGQPYAEESRDYLAEMIRNKALEMVIVGTDSAKRPLVLLSLDGMLINAKLAEVGLAEVAGDGLEAIPRKLRHQMENAEYKAKQLRTNIWGLTNYVRPVEHRIRQQNLKPQP